MVEVHHSKLMCNDEWAQISRTNYQSRHCKDQEGDTSYYCHCKDKKEKRLIELLWLVIIIHNVACVITIYLSIYLRPVPKKFPQEMAMAEVSIYSCHYIPSFHFFFYIINCWHQQAYGGTDGLVSPVIWRRFSDFYSDVSNVYVLL